MNTPIPENLIQVCRDLAAVAKKHKLHCLDLTFEPNVFDTWHSKVEAHWQAGRHEEDCGTVRIITNHYLNTQIKV